MKVSSDLGGCHRVLVSPENHRSARPQWPRPGPVKFPLFMKAEDCHHIYRPAKVSFTVQAIVCLVNIGRLFE